MENEQLRNENEFLLMELTNQNQKYEEKIKYMQAELCDIKRAVAEHEETTPSSSSPPKLAHVTNNYHKSNFSAKVLRKCVTQSNIASNFCDSVASLKKDNTAEKDDRPRSSRFDSEEIPGTSEPLIAIRSRAPRVPKPPPLPSSSQSSSASLSDSADRALAEISNIPPPPAKSKVSAPPPPPPPPAKSKVAAPPAPPPPPPKGGKSKVRRVPEVVEFYHSLMRRDSSFRRDSSASSDGILAGAAAKDMIGEIENRSSHLLAVNYFFYFYYTSYYYFL